MQMEYCTTLYNQKSLKEMAHAAAPLIPEDVTCLVSRGSSGCAFATALMMVSEKELHHLYIRKEDESKHSHSSICAGFPHLKAKEIYCFVDDFINSGKSMLAACKGVLEYRGDKVKYALVGHMECDFYKLQEKFSSNDIHLPKLIVLEELIDGYNR